MELQALHSASFAWALTCCRGRHDDAEEALQMTYLKILQGRAVFAGQSSFKTWLFGVIRFTALEYRRRIWFRWMRMAPLAAAGEAASGDLTAIAAAARSDTTAAIQIALGKLTTRQREVLLLVFHHGLTLDEAAVAMNVSPGSARTHYERGKHHLRRLLDPSLLSS